LRGGQLAGFSRNAFGNYHLTHGTRFQNGYFYRGRNHNHWAYWYWDRGYGCNLFWDPYVCSFYYWCAPQGGYYPLSYCPYNTYSWEDSGDVVPPVVPNAGALPPPVQTDPPPAEEEPLYGMKITDMDPKGSAYQEGLRVGDVILAVNGQPTPVFENLRAALQAGGSRADVVFLNKDNGKVERVIVRPVDTRIGVTVEEVRVQ